MAMRIGEEYSTDKVTVRDWKKFATYCELSDPLLLERIQLLAIRLRTVLEKHDISNEIEEKIIKYINTKCSNIMHKAVL